MRSICKVLCVASLAGLVVACGPQHSRRDQQNAQYQNPTTQAQLPTGRGGLRRVCADEIQKYCANEPKMRRCLRQNRDQLGATCKAAYDAAVERQRERKLERMNSNQTNGAPATGNQMNGTQPQGQQHLLNNVQPNKQDDDDDN